LKSKADGLAAEVTQLKTNQAKAQELFDKRRVEAESRERNLQQRLQAALDSLRGKPWSLFHLRFAKVAFLLLIETLLFFMKLLPN
jgi:hypothetical protein